MQAETLPPTQSLTHRVATEVRAEMARHQVSQRQLCSVLNISQPQLSKRLLGTIAFDTAELDRLAEHFGIPVERFLVAPAIPAGAA